MGKNPKLSQAKSKNDKNISGLLAQIEAGKIGIHTFTNASAFTVADVDTKIISIEFTTTEANHAQFFGQVIVDVTAQPVTRSVTASGDWVLCWPSFLFNQFEMVFSAFDDSLTLHFPQLFGHICSFQIEIISKLLSVKGNVKFHGVFLQRNGIKIG